MIDIKNGVVRYSDFGAVGNGQVDDYDAIVAAHEYANANGLRVEADEGATYYIARFDKSAIIKTDVDWTGASFTIEDRDFSIKPGSETADMNKPIFRIAPDFPKVRIDDRELLDRIVAEGFNRETTRVSLGLGYPVMIIPFNSKHKVYRRRAYRSFRGQTMQDVILLDKDGNVDKSTPLMFDYNYIDCIDLYRVRP